MINTNIEPTETNEPQLNYLEAFRNLESDSGYKSNLLSLLMSKDAHYGHQISSCNPLIGKYIYGSHGDVHVINLTYTIFLLKKVLNDLVAMFSEDNMRILFVGSKEQIAEITRASAMMCGQYYVNHRWFGGTLTNWSTIQKSIKKMSFIEQELENPDLHKKERQRYERILAKLNNSLGGVRHMSDLPNIIFISDTNREKVAIAEANKLKIPVIALVDSNSSPIGVDYPIPCNDDSSGAVELVSQLISEAVLTGMSLGFERKQSKQKEREQTRRPYSGKRDRDIVREPRSFEGNRQGDFRRDGDNRGENRSYGQRRNDDFKKDIR